MILAAILIAKNPAQYGFEIDPVVPTATETVVVPPALVKRFATGNGQATKDDVRRAILRKWGLSLLQEDQADAFVLAKIANAVATIRETNGETLGSLEREVVKKLLTPKGAKPRPRVPRSLNL